MNTLVWPLINTLLSLFIGQCIRYYPLRGEWRVSLKIIILIYTVAYIAICAIFIALQDYFAADYLGNQIFKGITGVVPLFIPFFLIKNRFFGNFFLMAIVANYILVIFGAGNYIELTFGGSFAEDFPYLICNAVVIILSVPVLPLLLRALRRLFGLFPGEKAPVWKIIWIIPALFAVLCLMSANIFMGEDAVTTVFFIARIFLGVGMIITCLLFARALRHEALNAELIEHTRMMELQLDLQREQYERLMENSEHDKAIRHDVRHQLIMLKGYYTAGDYKNLSRHLDTLTGSISIPKIVYCENYALNAILSHYLYSDEINDINIDLKFDIPQELNKILTVDLCVIIGNLLENAVEACNRMSSGTEKFIRIRSLIQGDYLAITIENSFDGKWDIRKGVYLSRKRSTEKENLHEGIGIESVKTICEKYEGRNVININNNIWKSSAVIKIN